MFHALENSYAVLEALRPLIASLKKRSRSLADQLERSGSGIPLNVAEGAERVGRDQLHLYRTAAGSCREARATLRAAIALGYLRPSDTAEAEQRLDRENALLHGCLRGRT